MVADFKGLTSYLAQQAGYVGLARADGTEETDHNYSRMPIRLMADAEGFVNDRPVVFQPYEADAQRPLTHFVLARDLIGEPLLAMELDRDREPRELDTPAFGIGRLRVRFVEARDE